MSESDLAALQRLLPVTTTVYELPAEGNVGLVIVDPGRGFTREGNLADPTHMVPMVMRIAADYQDLKADLGDRLHVLIFLDTHHADIPEPPYPPHGVIGTGEEDIDPALEFLLKEPNVTVIRKDCINGFVGAMEWSHRRCIEGVENQDFYTNSFLDWINGNKIGNLLVCGDCTDICDLDLVVTALSARNHGLFTYESPTDVPEERAAYIEAIVSFDIVVLTWACETFDAPAIGHPREAAHHVGLWTMASRGAILAKRLS